MELWGERRTLTARPALHVWSLQVDGKAFEWAIEGRGILWVTTELLYLIIYNRYTPTPNSNRAAASQASP